MTPGASDKCERFGQRVAIVTGAAQGIGRAIAERLFQEGAQVVIADAQAEKAAQVAAALASAGGRVLVQAGDLADLGVAEQLAQVTVEAFGQIDILVNNAGGGVLRPYLEHTEETLDRTLRANLLTAIRCSTAVFPHMKQRRYGRIVNIGADSVRNGLWFHAMYNAAKGGVNGLTTGLAREGAPFGITVNCVAPTGIETEAIAELLRNQQANPSQPRWNPGAGPPARSQLLEAVQALVPMGRLGRMAEVAAAVAFLASEEASFITGQVVSVNGGANML